VVASDSGDSPVVDSKRLRSDQSGVELGGAVAVQLVEAFGDAARDVGVEQLDERIGVQLGLGDPRRWASRSAASKM
jgi:hypothetical protein